MLSNMTPEQLNGKERETERDREKLTSLTELKKGSRQLTSKDMLKAMVGASSYSAASRS